jgi:large repetitive protein
VKVDFYIDGVLKSTDTSAPYAFAWDTTTSSNGSHTVRATATDAAGNAASATNTVTVANVTNQAPVAVNDSVTAPYRPSNSYTPRIFAVLANDYDPDGSLNVASVKIVRSPNKNGTVTVNSNGTVSYSPEKGYRGTETFTYNVKDNLGLISNTATVTVTIQ